MISRYILPAIAAASGAYGMSDDSLATDITIANNGTALNQTQCSVSATTTLSAITDATAVAGCATFSGSIALATAIAGDISFDGMQKLTGSLLGPNITGVTSISASTLTSIGGNLTLASGTALNTLNFPVLNSVGALSFITLGPQYQSTGFGNLTTVPSLTIQNTFLQDLSGISIASKPANIQIAQNQYLTTIDILVQTVTGPLVITANGNANGYANISLPYLTSAGSIDISNASSVSLPVLSNVTGSFYANGNNFQTLDLPNITQSNGFTLMNNNQMTNFTAPKYSVSLGSVNVEDNSALTGTIAMAALTTVDGSAYFTGAFSGLYLPKLNTDQGILNISSTNLPSSVCNQYTPLTGGVVHGKVYCYAGASSTASSSSSATGTASTSTSTAKTGAAVMVSPTAVSSFTVFGALAAFLGLLM